MNGAEIVAGSAITVVPSDPLHKLRKRKDQSTSSETQALVPNDVTITPSPRADVADTQNKDDELEDFFDSLV